MKDTPARISRWLTRWGAVVALLLVPAVAATAQTGGPYEVADPVANVLVFTETTQFRHTEAIDQGTPVLRQALADADITTVHTEDSSIFNDVDLATFDALLMFQTSGDPWTADEKAALERYQQAGGGIVAVHNATDMRGNYAWWDDMIGALMPGHAATGSSPGLPGTVLVEDRTHPSTEHLPTRWDRADEWYNYSANVRGEAHVLATMDESTYDPGGNAMGYDHPISWCRLYDGGRAWMTGMGHFGAHYTDEPFLVDHILGGVEWAAGLVEGDCGGTDWSEFERVTLDSNTSAPFAMDVASDGRVFFTELVRGQIRIHDPETQTTSTALTLDVYSGGEDGLLGIALDPDFDTNGHLFVYYSPDTADNSDPANFVSLLSRFTVEGNGIDPASEVVVMEVPASRLPDEPGHTGGGLRFGPDGDLYLSVGDDVNPHSEPSGGYAPLHESSSNLWDARATSANTNDLRGKLLRIHPEPDGSYTVPAGNLVDSDWAQALSPADLEKVRPEIYAMGFRNPFRFFVDPVTGDIGLADYSPDNNSDAPATRGPAGIAEWNWITEPGFYGWPLCMGANEPFRDVDYLTSPATVGDFFDCDAPINDSIHNTGVEALPPARPADVFYGYQRASDQGSGLNQGGGLAPMGGPVYDFDETLDSDTKFPSSYDGKAFFYEWSRNQMFNFLLADEATTEAFVPGEAVEKVTPFLPQTQFLAPIDSVFGPDGSLYVLDWGGGFGRDNPNSGLHRIDYISGSRSPIARISASPIDGQAPLEVTFSAMESTDPEGEALTVEWDVDGDGTIDQTGETITHTYETAGVYDARLVVTDPHGKTGAAIQPITVGNTRPVVTVDTPADGAFFDFGTEVSWAITATDVEDDPVDPDEVIVQPALGHDYHAHPTTEFTGLTGSVQTSLGGHAPDENIFFVLDARYTDHGGDGVQSLTGSDTVLVYPRLREAEFRQSDEGMTVVAARDVAGHGDALSGEDGAWFAYDRMSLAGIDELIVRAASAGGGTIELRADGPDGALIGSAEVPAGGLSRFVDVHVPVAPIDPGGSFALYVVMPGDGTRQVNFIEAVGQGVSGTTVPAVTITSPEPYAVVDEVGAIQLTADATDADNGIASVEFLVDGVSVGSDDTAPYEITWTPATEDRYLLEAVATNPDGVSTTSRAIQVDVGDLLAGWETFSHEAASATFDRPDADTWTIDSGGANTWQGTDEYGAVYQPAAAQWTQWTATVRVDSVDMPNASAKAGIIVRNDVTDPGSSPGYGFLTARQGNPYEWLRDSDGNGSIDAATNGASSSVPVWLRLTRDGDDYQAWSSSDGTTFTPIGGPVALPNAAAVQDVGLAVTAHSTTGRATATFSSFSIEEGVPTVEEPEPLPTCLTGSVDQFDGTEIDTGVWTTVRDADGHPVSVSDGMLHLPVTAGDINEDGAGPISYVGRPAPEGPWALTAALSLPHTREWQHAGLMLHASDDEYVKLAYTRSTSGNRFLEFQTETGGNRTWHANNVALDPAPDAVWFRMVSDGAAITAAYSTDGTTWIDLPGAAPVKPDADIGMVAAGDVTATEVVATVDWAALETPSDDDVIDPNDEFEGTALDTCRWNATVRGDANTLEVADGHLSITTQPGDINGGDNLDPRNFVLQHAPEGDWVATTRMRAPLMHQWQLAGLMAYGGDDDYVKLDVVARNAPGAPVDLQTELVSEQGGNFGAGGNRLVDTAETAESGYFYLRLTKQGDTYTGEWSDGGISWTPIGEPVTNSADLDRIGLLAIGPEQVDPVVVDFDWFHLDTEVVGDTTPPEVRANLLGTFEGDVSAIPGETIGGSIELVVGAEQTTVTATLSGLDAGATYQAHLHEGICGEMGAHYMDDPDGVEEPPNELWLVDNPSDPHAGFTASPTGHAVVSGSAPWAAASSAQSVMIHGGDAGLMIGCATLDTSADDVDVVIEATDDDGTVALVEHRLDGGDWTAHEGPITVTAAG